MVVELGVQSLHDASLVRINRGIMALLQKKQSNACTKRVAVYAHLIIGLPEETQICGNKACKDWWKRVLMGLNFTIYTIIDKTDLAREYAQEPFALLDEYNYAEALMELLRYIPAHIPILRLATDTPNHELLAPLAYGKRGSLGSMWHKQCVIEVCTKAIW